eukprot:TRINITY_DN3723_c0_g1_i1.p1 TRINITY_DN3723_c0_g1~~TRINITY_DN3723_c0_g1_i1.p1  ORF type:complete len:404 (-),score=91.80 TRINITY_DN3723_c0_g1_i1:304-1515(-)
MAQKTCFVRNLIFCQIHPWLISQWVFTNNFMKLKQFLKTCWKKRAKVLGELKGWPENEHLKPLLALMDDQELLKSLRERKAFSTHYLSQHHGVTAAGINALYDYAKFQFDTGNYSGALESLIHFRALSDDQEKCFSALWGKFAAEILMHEWEKASEDLSKLKDLIESRNASPLVQLQQRTWLIHWSLFIFFNNPNGRNGIIELFINSDKYLNTIQTTCPHILRYLTSAVITNKRKRTVLSQLVKVIQQESYTYKDPITEFLECLYVHFDFEGAQQKLRECEKVLSNDFFLVACQDEFMENARLFIFETYCRIHQCIDISMLAQKLNMDQEAAERWIVNLIRNAKFDAKIDSAANQVIMGTLYPNVYQQVIEKTKGIKFRSKLVASNLDKKTSTYSRGEEGRAK